MGRRIVVTCRHACVLLRRSDLRPDTPSTFERSEAETDATGMEGLAVGLSSSQDNWHKECSFLVINQLELSTKARKILGWLVSSLQCQRWLHDNGRLVNINYVELSEAIMPLFRLVMLLQAENGSKDAEGLVEEIRDQIGSFHRLPPSYNTTTT